MADQDKAAQHFDDAMNFCRKVGYRPELAWTCCDYADCLLQRPHPGDREQAISPLDESRAISRELGRRPLMVSMLYEGPCLLPASWADQKEVLPEPADLLLFQLRKDRPAISQPHPTSSPTDFAEKKNGVAAKSTTHYPVLPATHIRTSRMVSNPGCQNVLPSTCVFNGKRVPKAQSYWVLR